MASKHRQATAAAAEEIKSSQQPTIVVGKYDDSNDEMNDDENEMPDAVKSIKQSRLTLANIENQGSSIQQKKQPKNPKQSPRKGK